MTAYLDEELNKGAPGEKRIIEGIRDTIRAWQTVENPTSVVALTSSMKSTFFYSRSIGYYRLIA